MGPVIPVVVQKLWNAWNIRFLIVVSLSLQVFLNLTAERRKQSRLGRKWYFHWPFWLAYLSADWVAVYTIGLIFGRSIIVLPSESSHDGDDVLVFWAPFLLLHLGGPDNITAYALEDNELWKRHLFQLVIQIGFTVSIIVDFSSKNKLLLPSILVLFAGIIKYAERTISFYRASFDHFGDTWIVDEDDVDGDDDEEAQSIHDLPIPKQFQLVLKMKDRLDSSIRVAVQLFGIMKRLIVGPLIDLNVKGKISKTFSEIQGNHESVLLVMEIELSLLYEVLHTKLPVIASKIGFQFRIANLVFIFLALLSFSFGEKKHHFHSRLAAVDICLTYVLLIGAITLDMTSMLLLIKRSDWFGICRFNGGGHDQMLHKRRWSNRVSQSNLITYYKQHSVWSKKLVGLPCCTSKNIGGDTQLWSFIVEQVEQIQRDRQQIQQVWLMETRIEHLVGKGLENFHGLDFTRSLLLLHVASELCFLEDIRRGDGGGGSGGGDTIWETDSKDYRAICKLLSDYMFYLAVTQSTMMFPVMDNWESELRDYVSEITNILEVTESRSSKEVLVGYEILSHDFSHAGQNDRLPYAVELAKVLRMLRNGDKWKVMSIIWVQFMCFAAINCRPDVHARQLSKGGELLTFVWLLMNHFGLCLRSYTTLDLHS